MTIPTYMQSYPQKRARISGENKVRESILRKLPKEFSVTAQGTVQRIGTFDEVDLVEISTQQVVVVIGFHHRNDTLEVLWIKTGSIKEIVEKSVGHWADMVFEYSFDPKGSKRILFPRKHSLQLPWIEGSKFTVFKAIVDTLGHKF